MARFFGKTYCVRKCKKMDIENFDQSGTEGPSWNRHGYHIVLLTVTLTMRLAGDGPWLRLKLGISI